MGRVKIMADRPKAVQTHLTYSYVKKDVNTNGHNSVMQLIRIIESPLFTVMAIALLWQVSVWSGRFSSVLLPSIAEVFQALVALWVTGDLWVQIGYSLGTVIMGVVISFLMALFMIFMGQIVPVLQRHLYTLESIFNPLPGIAILPLVILWFGVSYQSMMVILFHACFWPLWAQLNLRILTIKAQYQPMIDVFKIPRRRQWQSLYLLGSKHEMAVALKTAWSRGWRALISIEMIFGMVGNHRGLGWLIYERRMYMDTAGLYAGLIVIAMLGIGVDRGVKVIIGRTK
jgi:NitT/TauT family transport system permease protein